MLKSDPFLTLQGAPSPLNLHPLAQRIREDIQVEESDIESPEKESLRSSPFPNNSPCPISPCAKGFPTPAPLVFAPVPPKKSSCLNCEAVMTPDHQCDATDSLPPDLGKAKQGSVIAAGSQSSTPPGSPLRNIGRRIFPQKTVNRTVKCHVCACLGRETSMVLCGSRCPSCGITANDS